MTARGWSWQSPEAMVESLNRTMTGWANYFRALEREVRELRQANEILRKASAYFAQAELDRPLKR